MAYAMTKQGSLDNCVTYEFICDTVEDMNAIENRYRTIGTVAVVLTGESDSLEVYIAGSDKQWNSLSSAGAASSDSTGGLSIYICAQNEVSNGLPDISEPDESMIYLVPAGNASGNLYEEYIYVDSAWEKFGAASIDLSNYIQKTDIATQSTAGLVKVLDNGNVTFNENNQLVLTLAGTAVVKTGQSDHPISVTHQHEAAFYGLAKAAGQDMKNSNNAVGTYTTEAATAIRNMIGAGTYSKPQNGIPAADLAETYLTIHQDISGKADKVDTILTTTLSRGRLTNSTVGSGSFAFGKDVTASRQYAHAEGDGTIASGYASHAEGSGTTADGQFSHAQNIGSQANAGHSSAAGLHTIADGSNSFVFGKYNIADSNSAWPTWTPGTSYTAGQRVKKQVTVNNEIQYFNYECTTDNSDAEFNPEHWIALSQELNFVEIVGNGNDTTRSNARALDWNGNEHLMGDLYIRCNPDSTGGSKVATEATVTALTARVATLEAEMASLRAALEALAIPVAAVTMENNAPLTDESGNYIEYDTPTT